MSVETDLTLTDLDIEIANLERALCLARECGFENLVKNLERKITEEVLPVVLLLSAVHDDDEREQIAVRFRRLHKCLGYMAT
jgi:hypothetical protein